MAGMHCMIVYAQTTRSYDWTNVAKAPGCLDHLDWIISHHKPKCMAQPVHWICLTGPSISHST